MSTPNFIKPLGVGKGLGFDFGKRAVKGRCNVGGDEVNVFGLVNFAAERFRREVRTVGFKDNTVKRNGGDCARGDAVIFVRYRPPEREVGIEMFANAVDGCFVLGKTMKQYTVIYVSFVGDKDFKGVVKGIAGVNNKGQPKFIGQDDLAGERRLLGFGRVLDSKVIKAAFADCEDF